MPRFMSFAATTPQVLNRTKTVTRRAGWHFLKEGEILTAIEWSHRVGQKLACQCGPVTGPGPSLEGALCACCATVVGMRGPRALCNIRVIGIRRERLGEITAADVAREGFPGWDPERFIEFYCAPADPSPSQVVTRIEFEYLPMPVNG